MSIFIFMNLVVNLYIVLLNCCNMLLNFLLIFAVKLCLIILVVNLYIVLIHLCTVHAKSVMNHACIMFRPWNCRIILITF